VAERISILLEVTTPVAWKIKTIHVQAGDAVQFNQALMEFA